MPETAAESSRERAVYTIPSNRAIKPATSESENERVDGIVETARAREDSPVDSGIL